MLRQQGLIQGSVLIIYNQAVGLVAAGGECVGVEGLLSWSSLGCSRWLLPSHGISRV